VTSEEFGDRLRARAAHAGLSVSDEAIQRLEAYFSLLARWNRRINLTALPLDDGSASAIDRLLIEPLAAVRYAPSSLQTWFDIGSGGGSPAIPLKMARPEARLTMVEVREKKAAFLREAVRLLELSDVEVVGDRFERVAERRAPHMVELATVRAVRIDEQVARALDRILTPDGRLLLFHSLDRTAVPDGFERLQTAALGVGDARLSVCRRVFHVEQLAQTD
jgi:16S rRNA (guanine527-N7)-methyltransferase